MRFPSTKALNQAIKRNAERFPDDFAFLFTPAEKAEVVTNCDHLARLEKWVQAGTQEALLAGEPPLPKGRIRALPPRGV
ncbi:MAG: ORF6N domain-containing protein [Verrucomicrobiota bacterium]